MSELVNKYQLKTGALLAAVLPGIFVFSVSTGREALFRFLFSFCCIFAFWVINFALVDFSCLWNNKKETGKLLRRILLSTLLAVIVFVGIGFADESRLLLSQVKGDLIYSRKAWFYLILRISLLNGLTILIKYFYDLSAKSRRVELELETLKRENLIALHESLKQQLNPHFLFNSLTTLKSLVKQDQVQSLKFIDELASIYRYMLVYNGKAEVTLNEEIRFLESYVGLLQIRYGDAFAVDIQLPPSILGATLPPNTLQILIENVVKHNIFSRKRPLKVRIYEEAGLLIVENNLQFKKAHETSGVGLSNVNNRFGILKGKGIIVEKNDSLFKVSLPIAD
ncbi:histidine kinase [Dyadobacter sp. 676]|uniref:Histidine kinase n=1 Tax=Dyadobacter sp. 676 TaxID=3088362 RepID=A0AAU8FLY3_9BACT